MILGLGSLLILFGLFCLAVTLWGIIDAANRPDYAWTAAEQNKTLWVALQGFGLLFAGLGGLLMAVVYLAVIRPKVKSGEAARSDAERPSVV